MTVADRAFVVPGDVLAGKYRVVRTLGQGGMGHVLEARHVDLGDRVAIKLLTVEAARMPDMRRRFLREARAARLITSHHAVKVFDFGTLESGAPYLVMELLEGEDLRHVLSRKGRVSARRAAAYVRDACEAIGEAHRVGVVHRDIKVENLFLARGPGREAVVKVLDFGIAKMSDDSEDGEAPLTSLTHSGSTLGTPACMSPEQLRSTGEVDLRTDIWSLGVVLYQLVTGQYPFEGSGLMGMFAAILGATPRPPSEVFRSIPSALDAIVMRCLEKDPDNRYSSAAELADALDGFLGSVVDPALEDTLPEPEPEVERLAAPTALSARTCSTNPAPPGVSGAGAAHAPTQSSREDAAPSAPAGEAARERTPVAPAGVSHDLPATRGRVPQSSWRRRARAWPAIAGVSLLVAAAALGIAASIAKSVALRWGGLSSLGLATGYLLLRIAFARVGRGAPRIAGSPQLTRGGELDVAMCEELRRYLARAGVCVERSEGHLHFLSAPVGSPLHAVRLAAVVFADRIHPRDKSLSTKAFGSCVPQLFGLAGTDKQPWYVLAFLERQPRAGVFRLWNSLEARHVRVLPVSPHLLRAALESDPAEHLCGMIRSAPRDPFELPGPVPHEVCELEFFGGGETIQDMLNDLLERQCPGIGVFGLSKWGVTSMLRRFRLELGEQDTVWVDLRALPEITEATVIGAIHERVRSALAPSSREPSRLTAAEAERAIVALLSLRRDPRPLVLFLDHVDRLGAAARDGLDLPWTVWCLYRLLAREGRPRLQIVFGGQDDSLFSRHSFLLGGAPLQNPLWEHVKSYHVPLFDAGELSELFERLGGKAGLRFSGAAVREAHRLTGGHKYLSRRLGSLLFRELVHKRRSGAEASAADVKRCADILRAEEGEYFRALRDHLPEEARLCLIAMAERDRVEDGTGAAAARLGAHASFLSDYSLVSREPGTGSHKPAIGLFSEWLLRAALSSAAAAPSGPVALPPGGEGPLPTMLVRQEGLIDGHDEHGASGPPSAIQSYGAVYSSSMPPPPASVRAMPARRPAAPRRDIVIVCAPCDTPVGQELERFMRPHLQSVGLELWGEWQLKPGARDREIEAAVEAARLFVVLASPAFLSDARCSALLRRIEDRVEHPEQRRGEPEARMVPVLLAPCHWDSIGSLKHRKALPASGQPIAKWPNRDEALHDVSTGLLETIKEMGLTPPVERAAAYA